MHEDESRIKKEMQALATARQWLITQARKGTITSADLEYQLSGMSMQEVNLKRELASLGQAINTNMLDNWESKFDEYMNDLRAGIDELKNAAPQTVDERRQVFLLQKRIVNSLVSKVVIDKDRNLEVHIRFDLFSLNNNNPAEGDSSTVVQVSRAEFIPVNLIYTAQKCFW